MTNSGKHIRLPAPFSNGDRVEWFVRFEIHCQANDWMKTTQLPTLLEWKAIMVWFKLMSEEQGSYDTAKEKIIKQMAPACLISLANFHKRTLLPGEPSSVFAHELKRLLKQALPIANTGISKQLLLHQFTNSLLSRISAQLRTGGQIDNLKTAMERPK